ncbi:MAG: DUF882 domain-containing protein [Desulfobacteraceae bacterium]|nr:DUF882 domain-containing protein [Desulfobacteraceae bacterium]
MDNKGKPRVLSFYNTHTAEKLTVCYYFDGTYRIDALNKINHILRDHRTGDIKSIDPNLLDQLYYIMMKTDKDELIQVVSGYRSEKTNKMLRKTSAGVAKKSLHTLGQAIDIRISSLTTRKLHNVCIDMKAGGVGYYPKSGFVHLDTGRVRCWNETC